MRAWQLNEEPREAGLVSGMAVEEEGVVLVVGEETKTQVDVRPVDLVTVVAEDAEREGIASAK